LQANADKIVEADKNTYYLAGNADVDSLFVWFLLWFSGNTVFSIKM
jgi:hypothetical protein